MLTIYIGSTFNLAGTLQKDGAPGDFTGWGMSANLYDATGSTLIAALTVTWIDQTKGLLTLSAPDTSTWAAQKARIDTRIVSPTGDVVLGPPAFLRIAQSPLS
ncbi:hypothetical protein [Pandoraea pnomenusa]|uniref:hypothetical protein n=1 Tax=Pandoraea pnomenusa TaxID=93220 RepID=UPI001AC2DAAC|nr:hypothetical protein [Pandoraea pnomenusa]MBN9093917.1 hypothetical protein [Pandoraea pnomenusa]